MAKSKEVLSEGDLQVVELWKKRPATERTEFHVIAFYGWLRHNRPELLSSASGESEGQRLTSLLKRHFVSPPRSPRRLSLKKVAGERLALLGQEGDRDQRNIAKQP